jgi:hypothetical protein
LTIRAIFCGLLLVAAGRPLLAGEQMTMKVSPEVAFAPADLYVRASIEADDQNRALEVILDSPDFYRSSLIALEGERAPRTTVVELRNVPSGHYVVTTRLLGPSGQTRSTVRRAVTVMSPGDNR